MNMLLWLGVVHYRSLPLRTIRKSSRPVVNFQRRDDTSFRRGIDFETRQNDTLETFIRSFSSREKLWALVWIVWRGAASRFRLPCLDCLLREILILCTHHVITVGHDYNRLLFSPNDSGPPDGANLTLYWSYNNRPTPLFLLGIKFIRASSQYML